MPPQDANPTPSFGGFGLKDIRMRRKHLSQPGSVHSRNTVDLTRRVQERDKQPGVSFRGEARNLQDTVGLTREY